MQVKYQNQRYIVRPGMLISINVQPVFSAKQEPNWENGKVVDLLGTQFTALLDTQTEEVRILMYQGVGESWKPRI